MNRTVTPPGMLLLAEKQMRVWELAHEMGEPRIRERPPVRDFVSISRAAGLDGGEIARPLARRLGWLVYDHEVLELMAKGDRQRLARYEFLDQRDLSWLEENVLSLGTTEYRWNEHFHVLARTVLAIAEERPAVFVGRAADLILPRERGLRVRITASREYVASRHAGAHGITPEAAAREIDRLREERDEFIWRHFQTDPDAPGRSDLAVNRETFSAEDAVEIILAACRARGVGNESDRQS